MVGIQTCLAPSFGGALHGIFVQPPHLPVQGHPSEDGKAGDELRHLRPVGRDGSMALDQNRFHACLLRLFGRLDVIYQTRVDIRSGMDMKINRSLQQFPGALFRNFALLYPIFLPLKTSVRNTARRKSRERKGIRACAAVLPCRGAAVSP